MKFELFVLILMNELLRMVFAGDIGNGIIGDPNVNCVDDRIILNFDTEKPFTGRVYAKGLTTDATCSRDYSSNQFSDHITVMIETDMCGVKKQQMTSNSTVGILYSVVLVVSFHGTFITKADRAFRCMCFTKTQMVFTNSVDIGTVGTTEIRQTAMMPSCTYKLRIGGPNGPERRFAKVGDKLVHVWECDSESYGFLVHSCSANDGLKDRFHFYDDNGCAIDPVIMPDVTYSETKRQAYVETHGFKFSGTSSLNFQCILELCNRRSGECEQLPTPPNCRFKRRRSAANLAGFQSDLEIEASIQMLESFENIDQTPLFDASKFGNGDESAITGAHTGKLCLTEPIWKSLLTVAILSLLTVAVSGLTLKFLRKRRRGVETMFPLRSK